MQAIWGKHAMWEKTGGTEVGNCTGIAVGSYYRIDVLTARKAKEDEVGSPEYFNNQEALQYLLPRILRVGCIANCRTRQYYAKFGEIVQNERYSTNAVF